VSLRNAFRSDSSAGDDGTMIPFLPAALPALVVPGADFPPWAPFAFGAIGLATVAVLIYQAVRYFRNNRD
jgi:hypothetical protein